MDATPEAAAPFATDVDFPVVLDRGHLLGELFGVVNVPSGIWVDEQGTVVRPPETAYPARPGFLDAEVDESAVPPDRLERVRVAQRHLKAMRIDADGYVAALRDWVAHGADSRFALSAEEVLERSRPRPPEQAQAAAAFALGQHLHATGRPEAAVRWFRESHRLQPDNWTYRRQAWTHVDRAQGPTEQYDGDWLTDVQRVGGESYYEPLELEPRRPR